MKELLGSLKLNRIYQMDCLDGMKSIPDKSIDLTVTSPPYDKLRYYKGYSFDFTSVAKELFRVTKEGGVVIWVVNDATEKGSKTGSSFKQALYFKEIGFNIHDTMIYAKSKIVPTDFKCHRYYQGFEYMFVFSKGKPKTCNYIRVPSKHSGKKTISINRKEDGSMREDRFDKQKGRVVAETKIKSNIWEYASQPIKGHPAPFPEQLANDHIVSWSNECDIVLDPFIGSGTTAKMAQINSRNWIGFELASEYIEIANKRLDSIDLEIDLDKLNNN